MELCFILEQFTLRFKVYVAGSTTFNLLVRLVDNRQSCFDVQPIKPSIDDKPAATSHAQNKNDDDE